MRLANRKVNLDFSETCKWLHEQLELLPIFKYPFDLKLLPKNGVYFFYEEGEKSDHGDGIKQTKNRKNRNS